ncbi:hypothetical protein [Novipirellula artificiosorum]|uniref:Replication initiator protein A n=1 Tax=Novipirellula artificiosorum TaxID=2528016 RepID=A0A5C6DGF1_9BACT|nr:hypothetical protein [Novipirellula artificiosorum]TWU34897.1 hypothetical protein Poly41_40400 [Novipirellula artificiosorum]
MKDLTMAPNNGTQRRISGVGQLSLVEHALCPLDPRLSLVENAVYAASYSYSNQEGKRSQANTRVFAPLGLSASDELFLWGLLSLSLRGRGAEPESELVATPHWFLSQLGLINQSTRRGGRQYQQFREAIRRLSVVNYMNDAFYDPMRREHRQVSFGFLSYSLPAELRSSRAWKIAWNPIFFEMVQAIGGNFRFDLAQYRAFDTASRRLFLFVSKILSRRVQLQAVEFDQLSVDTLGFSPSVPRRVRKDKVSRHLQKLIDLQVLSEAKVYRTSTNKYFVSMTRGNYFSRQESHARERSPAESPMMDSLLAIGFEREPAVRLISRFRYRPRLLAEWCDITQAAIERFGKGFFKKSPMAFLIDSVDKASKGSRTPPDWWLEIKRLEQCKHDLTAEGRTVFAKLQSELFGKVPTDHRSTNAKNEKNSLTAIGTILGSSK